MTGFAFGEPIGVIDRVDTGTKDEFGNTIWDDVPLKPTPRGAFAPAIGFESTGDKDQVTSQPQVLFQGADAKRVAAVIKSTSKLVARGKAYEVDGEPEDWLNIYTGWDAGLVVPLKRVTG